MTIGHFELFFILLFSFIYYVCYNLLVANYVRYQTLTKKELTSLILDRATTLAGDIKFYLTREEIQLANTDETVLYNQKTLSALLTDTATEADYETFLDGIVEVVKDLYKNYQFLRQDPAPEDYSSGYYLGFQFIRGEYPEKYEKLFRLAVDKGLDVIKLNNLFVERAVKGDVIDLGDAEVDSVQTGLSSILQGQDVRISITFAPADYVAKKNEYLAQRTKDLEAQQQAQQELAKQKDEVLKSIRVAQGLLDKLVDETAEKNNLQELVDQLKENMGYL